MVRVSGGHVGVRETAGVEVTDARVSTLVEDVGGAGCGFSAVEAIVTVGVACSRVAREIGLSVRIVGGSRMSWAPESDMKRHLPLEEIP